MNHLPNDISRCATYEARPCPKSDTCLRALAIEFGSRYLLTDFARHSGVEGCAFYIPRKSDD